MNYIHQLQNDLAEKTAELDALKRGLNDLQAYLATDKFAVDTTVQVRDIEHRLTEARHAASTAANDDATMRTFDGVLYSMEQLTKAFDAVSPKEDWKGQVRAEIAVKDWPVTKAAVAFYTATEAVIEERHDGVITAYCVVADGYRAGPAGDH